MPNNCVYSYLNPLTNWNLESSICLDLTHQIPVCELVLDQYNWALCTLHKQLYSQVNFFYRSTVSFHIQSCSCNKVRKGGPRVQEACLTSLAVVSDCPLPITNLVDLDSNFPSTLGSCSTPIDRRILLMHQLVANHKLQCVQSFLELKGISNFWQLTTLNLG